MLYWAAVFFVIALVAALLGFAGVATAAAGAAKILFYIFLVVFLVTLIMGLGRRGTRVSRCTPFEHERPLAETYSLSLGRTLAGALVNLSAPFLVAWSLIADSGSCASMAPPP